jgi:Zn finger protein HypA/HybF involved in hydrogenase expression
MMIALIIYTMTKNTNHKTKEIKMKDYECKKCKTDLRKGILLKRYNKDRGYYYSTNCPNCKSLCSWKAKQGEKTNIKKWAQDKKEEMLKDIKDYILDGWDKNKAVELVLNGSTVGAGIKAQIRHEAKSL